MTVGRDLITQIAFLPWQLNHKYSHDVKGFLESTQPQKTSPCPAMLDDWHAIGGSWVINLGFNPIEHANSPVHESLEREENLYSVLVIG